MILRLAATTSDLWLNCESHNEIFFYETHRLIWSSVYLWANSETARREKHTSNSAACFACMPALLNFSSYFYYNMWNWVEFSVLSKQQTSRLMRWREYRARQWSLYNLMKSAVEWTLNTLLFCHFYWCCWTKIFNLN